jgi:hypothetical protein
VFWIHLFIILPFFRPFHAVVEDIGIVASRKAFVACYGKDTRRCINIPFKVGTLHPACIIDNIRQGTLYAQKVRHRITQNLLSGSQLGSRDEIHGLGYFQGLLYGLNPLADIP